MNGNKVLNRLIQVFLVINILLFILCTIKLMTSYVLSENRVKNITGLLNERSISINKELPRIFTPKAKGLIIMPESTPESREKIVKQLLLADTSQVTISTASNGRGGTSRIYKKGSKSVTFAKDETIYTDHALRNKELVSRNAAKRKCKAFIDKIGLAEALKNAYIEDRSTDNNRILIFYPRLDGIPVFDSYIVFRVTSGGIAKAVMHVTEIKQQKIEYAIFPIDIVLFSLEDKLQLKKPARIADITLGYHSSQKEGMDILEEEIIPVYKIQIEGLNTPVFVNAYTNERLNSNFAASIN